MTSKQLLRMYETSGSPIVLAAANLAVTSEKARTKLRSYLIEAKRVVEEALRNVENDRLPDTEMGVMQGLTDMIEIEAANLKASTQANGEVQNAMLQMGIGNAAA